MRVPGEVVGGGGGVRGCRPLEEVNQTEMWVQMKVFDAGGRGSVWQGDAIGRRRRMCRREGVENMVEEEEV